MTDKKIAEPTASSAYKPSLTGQERIVLPQRFGVASLVLLALLATIVSFTYNALQPAPLQPASPQLHPAAVSAISPAEAAPLLKPEPVTHAVTDHRLDEAAALMPQAALQELPTKTVTSAKTHTIDISVEPPLAQLAGSPVAHLPLSAEIGRLAAAGITAGRSGNYVSAGISLRAALALDRDNPIILYNLALIAEHRGDRDSARTLYEAALRHVATRPDAPLSPELINARLDQLDATTYADSFADEAQP